MDALVSSALEEVCAARLSDGLLVADLWPALSGAFQAAGLPPDLPIKSVLFARLIALPVINLEPDLRDVEEAERRGARLLATRDLRDNFLGLYDHRYSASRLSANQRKTLEHVGASRTSGVTQRTLCKEFGLEPKNFHYVVHSLQSQGLIVGKQAIENSSDTGGARKVVSTNSLYLSRYAKQLNMNSYQRIEITMPKLGEYKEINIDALQEEDETLKKSNISVHDYVPAMKAICDKLEEASGKVLAVSDIKKDLGWAWRSVLHRLLDAQLVEEISAQVDDEVVCCLRLLKKFSPNEFNPKSTTSNYKLGKKCLETDQFMELPLDNSIYDMIHDTRKDGATLVELGRRLGGKYNNPKELAREMGSKEVDSQAERHAKLSDLDDLSSCRRLLSASHLENSYSGWPWDAMKIYAEQSPSLFCIKNETLILSSDLFRTAFCIIHQTGEQGVNLREILQKLHPLGMQSISLVVDTLERFQLAIKKPINLAGDTRNILKEKPINLHGTVRKLGEGHTVTVVNLKRKPSPHSRSQSRGDDERSSSTQHWGTGCCNNCGNHIYHPILLWINGDGSMNKTVYEGLSRRVIGYAMQYPGISEEDFIRRMDVLNPQTCRTLLGKLTVDEHLYVVHVDEEPVHSAAPTMLRCLLRQQCHDKEESSKSGRRYLANPMSTFML